MRVLRILAVLTAGAAGGLAAQLAAPQPTEKLLVLPLSVANPADSAASIATMDAVRARIISLARYKVNTIPKAKLCEVLQQSGFGCDVLITPQQAEQLSKALGINSYTGGMLTHTGNLYIAKVHVVSGASGFASTFTINGAATPPALGEAIAQRLNNIVKAAESARNCNEQRSHNALDRALAEARKAFTIEPNLAEAWVCIASVHEVKKSPTDSMVQAYRGALKGDSANSGVWSRLANLQMAKGDTDGALGTYAQELLQNPSDKQLTIGLAGQQLQRKKYPEALTLVENGLKVAPADQQLSELRRRIVQDGATNASDPAVKKTMSEALLGMMRQEATTDTTKLADTNNLKLAIGTAQVANDTAQLLWWTHAAVRAHPTSMTFIKQLAGSFLFAGQTDSAMGVYRQVLAANPNDVQTSLLVAKTIVDDAVWDTAAVRKAGKDTAALRRLREPFVAKINPARPLLAPGYAAADSGLKLTAYFVGVTGGSKLAQAGAYDDAYVWLDELLTRLGPASASDTSGAKNQFRSQASFWFVLPLLQKLGADYNTMSKSKNCGRAKDVNDELQRLKSVMSSGRRLSPTYVDNLQRQYVAQFEKVMPQIRSSFHCSNF